MGWFRPRRTVRDPLGQEWELYVSRFIPPRWQQVGAAEGLGLQPVSRLAVPIMVVSFPFLFADFLVTGLILPALRFGLLLPASVVKGRRAQAVRIEAICFFPWREVRLWTTTPDRVASVLDEVAAGLAEGKFVQPTGAVYSGSRPG